MAESLTDEELKEEILDVIKESQHKGFSATKIGQELPVHYDRVKKTLPGLVESGKLTSISTSAGMMYLLPEEDDKNEN